MSSTLTNLFLNLKKNLFSQDIYYDSKTIIATQRSLYQWFYQSLENTQKNQASAERLTWFKPIIDEIKDNGRVDSGTKITFLSLLRDLDQFNFSKLRQLNEQMKNKKKTSKKRNLFFIRLVNLKFDLKLCSVKEFCELINKIDNCAIKYIQLTNKCKIVMRDIEHLTIKHFMGEVEATIEAKSEKILYRAELSLKRLADAVHYRLAKQIPSCDTMMGNGNSLKILLQSPPQSIQSTPHDTSADLTSSQNLTSTTDYTASTNSTRTTSEQTESSLSSSNRLSDSMTSSKSSGTLNGDHNDSFLDLSRNSIGTTTPLTSSPMSSSSSPLRFKFETKKKTKTSHKNKKSQKAKQPAQKVAHTATSDSSKQKSPPSFNSQHYVKKFSPLDAYAQNNYFNSSYQKYNSYGQQFQQNKPQRTNESSYNSYNKNYSYKRYNAAGFNQRHSNGNLGVINNLYY